MSERPLENKVTKDDIYEIMMENPILYNCMQYGRRAALPWEEIMMLAVRELHRANQWQHKQLMAYIQSHPGPMPKFEVDEKY